MREITCNWRIRRTANGYEGTITFPAGAAPVRVSTGGRDPQEAIARAAVIARQVAASPIFVAVAPPGTAAAIEAINAIAKSPDVKAARDVLARYTGRGARRLARALGF